ncbi:TRAP transporter substrate-binding protein [Chloroflexota bacterium]
MKKKLLLIPLVLVLIASLIACAAPAPVAGPSPTATVTTTVTAPAPVPVPGDVYEWTMFTNGSGGWHFDQWRGSIVNELENATNGRLKIVPMWPGDHPYKAGDLLGTVKEGITPVTALGYNNVGGVEPRLSVTVLPFFQPPGGHEAKKDMHRLISDYIDGVLEDWNCFELAVHFAGPVEMWLTDGWLEDFDSLKGKRIRTFSAETDSLVQLMNGNPVRIDASEVYTSLQTGLIEGLMTGVSFSVSSKFPEVVKHFQPLNAFQSTAPILVNRDAWNELPEEIRDAVMAYWDSKAEWYADGAVMTESMLLRQAVTEYGLEIRPMPQDFRAEIMELSVDGVWKPWAERTGEGGMEILESITKILEDAGYEMPAIK